MLSITGGLRPVIVTNKCFLTPILTQTPVRNEGYD